MWRKLAENVPMRLSIITINYNNVQGLRKTLDSILSQSNQEFEHIIVDGASTDGSKDLLEAYTFPHTQWASEPDKGIYNAMNKGIRMATGDYIQILNSGDILASNNVVEDMYNHLAQHPKVDILYGNMIKMGADGHVIGKSGEIEYSVLQFYHGTLNHDCAYIRRELFNDAHFGLYDEELKIVSDWKWYTEVIAFGGIRPTYVNVDMTIFDGSGISETNLKLREDERRRVLEHIFPPALLMDYDRHALDMIQMDNLRRHPWAYKLVWTLERVLNRIDHRKFTPRKK